MCLRTEQHTDFEQINHLQVLWDEYVLRCDGDVYLTYDWCKIWWDYYGNGRDLNIYLFWQNEELVGVFPMFVETIRLGLISVTLAKVVGADHTVNCVNLPVLDDFGKDQLEFLLSDLMVKKRCDAIWMGPISASARCLTALYSACKSMDKRIGPLIEHEYSSQTFFILPDTFELYIKSLRKKQRSNFRRSMKLLHESYTVQIDALNANDGNDLEQFMQMHETQWNAQGKLGHFNDWPQATNFIKSQVQSLIERGRYHLIRWKVDEQAIAYNLCFQLGPKVYWWLPARRHEQEWNHFGLGSISLIQLVDWAISKGAKIIDGGMGRYEYKLKSGGVEAPVMSLLIVHRSYIKRFRLFMFQKIGQVLNLLYYRIWYIQIAHRLPFKRKPLWEKWIRTRL